MCVTELFAIQQKLEHYKSTILQLKKYKKFFKKSICGFFRRERATFSKGSRTSPCSLRITDLENWRLRREKHMK